MAHRFAWESSQGPLSEGADLHHQCENKPCVRPEHMQVIDHVSHGTHHGLEAQGVPFEQQGKLTAARVRKMAAEARLAELALAREEGQLLTVVDFERELAKPLDRLRARLLNMPSRWAPQTVGCRTILESQAQWEAAIREAIDVMRRDLLEDDDDEEHDGNGSGRAPRRAPRRPRGRPRGARSRPKALRERVG